jgi:hypothetical protein
VTIGAPATADTYTEDYQSALVFVRLLSQGRHQVYVEPFAGGLSVLLNKTPCKVEVANDLNAGLIDFYRALRDQTEEFLGRVDALAYNAETFEWAKQPAVTDGLVEAAVRFIVRNRPGGAPGQPVGQSFVVPGLSQAGSLRADRMARQFGGAVRAAEGAGDVPRLLA